MGRMGNVTRYSRNEENNGYGEEGRKENAIIILRDSFNWGTHRIKMSLQSPPPYIKYLFENVFGEWENIDVTR
ncbi:MAG: hypothetical protein J7K95_04455 [Thermoplasmata archaeon]|nr:hypothetical protein [Thermoplasmata archaeon]